MVPGTIWGNRTYGSKDRLIVDLHNNLLSDISSILNPPTNVSLRLQGILCVQVPTSSRSHNFVDPILMIMWNLLEVTQFHKCLSSPDDAATSQKPYAVLDVLRDYVRATARMFTPIFIT
ncbi:uncharacterized protein LOC116261340 [Nymphaea colorata]|nr:uncharacterized protein LOC116261340 [Nymphaea colorata]XP_049935637.1 uncharacterized protein LOC116261340 [Nymphaea colorata]